MSEAITKTLNLSKTTARQIFELNTGPIRTEGSIRARTEKAAVNGRNAALRQAVLDLSTLEQQELAAIAWLGSSIFENFEVALSYAQVLKGPELVEFLEMAPVFNNIDRGIRLLEDEAIHLS